MLCRSTTCLISVPDLSDEVQPCRRSEKIRALSIVIWVFWEEGSTSNSRLGVLLIVALTLLALVGPADRARDG